VVAAAVVLAVVPPLLGGQFDTGFYRGLALLIIACPCALVISTPVTVVSGIGAASRRGILIKGGAALDPPMLLDPPATCQLCGRF
jgi:Cd2+/Zn2+-exporting ATPase